MLATDNPDLLALKPGQLLYPEWLEAKALEAKAAGFDLWVAPISFDELPSGDLAIYQWVWATRPPGVKPNRPEFATDVLFYETSRWGRDA